MKKTAKFFMALGCMTLASGLVLPTLGNVAYADPDPAYDYTTTVEQAQIQGFATDYVIGEDEGKIKVTKPATCEVRVLDPSNRKVTLDADGFVPTMVGDYRVIYFMTSGSTEYVLSEKVIKVTKSGFYFEFPENTNRIIPSEMNIEISDKIKEKGFDGTILLPMPEVISSKTKKKVDGATVAVSVQKPSGSTATVSAENTFKPDKTGEYIFTYTYTLAGGTVAAQKQFSLNVNTTYKNDYTLNYSFNSTKPTTAVLGVETKLPTVSGTNKETGEKVDVYYTISITKGGVDKSSMLKDGVFTPTEKGDYVVKYTIKNVFGTEAESFSFTIKDVKDTKDPVVYYGKLEGEKIVDQSHTVPSKFGLENIVLPAIYATDNSGEAITYKREIYRIKTYTLDQGTIGSKDSKKPVILNYNENTFADKANISNYVIFNYYDNNLNVDGKEEAFKSGIYTISYTAIDSSKNDTTKSYTMELVDAYTPSTPEIDFGTVLPKQVKLGEEISFEKPTATDSNDDRMVVRTFFKQAGETETELTELESGKYTIKTTKAGTLEIRVETKNDDGAIGTITRTIEVLDITDTTLPSLVGTPEDDADMNAINDQFSEITLPTMTVTDDKVDYLSVVIKVYDKDGKSVAVSGKKLEKVTGGLKVSGAKFKASKSGNYRVSYVVTDIAGNTFLYTFKTNEVRATVAPTIVKPIFDESVQTLELGESLTLPIPSIKNGDGEEVNDPDYTVEVVSAEGEYEPIILGKFRPLTTGKFVIQYTVRDGSLETKSALYTIDVVNTLAPTIANEFKEFEKLEKNVSMSIPRVNVSTNGVNDVDWSKSKIEVLYNGSVYKTLELDKTYESVEAENEAYNYTFRRDGTYTIKYTVVDTVGNTATKSFAVKVGDTEKPTLELDSSIDFSDRKTGSTLVIDPAKITVKDNVDTGINIFDDLKIVVKNTTTGEEISNKFTNSTRVEGYEYNLSEVGTYQVTFTLTDDAGNVTTLVKEFAVTGEGAGKEFPTEVVGIILLVLAILILGGVVAYFIITRKKVKSPEQIKKMQEKKDAKKKK